MKFKEIKDKETYLKKHYIFKDVPKLTDQQKCIHCGENFIVGDYKVELVGKIEYIVCPNAPDCDGTLIDWINVR